MSFCLCQFWFDNDLPAQVDRLQRKLADATAKNATLSRIESEQRQAIFNRDQQLRQRDEQAAELRAQLGEREQEAAAALAELDRARDRLAEEIAAMNEDRRAQLVSRLLGLCLMPISLHTPLTFSLPYKPFLSPPLGCPLILPFLCVWWLPTGAVQQGQGRTR